MFASDFYSFRSHCSPILIECKVHWRTWRIPCFISHRYLRGKGYEESNNNSAVKKQRPEHIHASATVSIISVHMNVVEFLGDLPCRSLCIPWSANECTGWPMWSWQNLCWHCCRQVQVMVRKKAFPQPHVSPCNEHDHNKNGRGKLCLHIASLFTCCEGTEHRSIEGLLNLYRHLCSSGKELYWIYHHYHVKYQLYLCVYCVATCRNYLFITSFL